MQDFIKKYHTHKLFSNLNIILASLVLAIGINFVLIDGTDLGQNLKASVLNSGIQENKSDISIEKFEDNLYIIANKNINEVSNLSLSLTYNPENVSLGDVSSNIGDIINLSNTPGISSIILTTEESINIKSGDKLIKINVNKKEDITENLNIINANFKDKNEENYLLSTSGITF